MNLERINEKHSRYRKFIKSVGKIDFNGVQINVKVPEKAILPGNYISLKEASKTINHFQVQTRAKSELDKNIDMHTKIKAKFPILNERMIKETQPIESKQVQMEPLTVVLAESLEPIVNAHEHRYDQEEAVLNIMEQGITQEMILKEEMTNKMLELQRWAQEHLLLESSDLLPYMKKEDAQIIDFFAPVLSNLQLCSFK